MFGKLFDTDGLAPHGFCLLWREALAEDFGDRLDGDAHTYLAEIAHAGRIYWTATNSPPKAL